MADIAIKLGNRRFRATDAVGRPQPQHAELLCLIDSLLE
jgi:hypothetical protein